jgi:Spo7-like protein
MRHFDRGLRTYVNDSRFMCSTWYLSDAVNSIRFSQLVVGLLVVSSGFWTWQLRCKLAERVDEGDTMVVVRLLLAWALLGVTPLVLFFAGGMFQSTILEPSRFVERLNHSLARFHLAYSTESECLLRIEPVAEFAARRPVRMRHIRT